MAQLTTQQIQRARQWLCARAEAETEFEVMSANEIERAIARQFQGGLPAYVESCNLADETPMPEQERGAMPIAEAHDPDRADAAPNGRKCPQTHDSHSPDSQGLSMEATPETNLFGQYQPTRIKGKQMPLFHEPVDVPMPNARPAIDKRIARKFDEAATPMLFAEQTAKPGQHRHTSSLRRAGHRQNSSADCVGQVPPCVDDLL